MSNEDLPTDSAELRELAAGDDADARRRLAEVAAAEWDRYRPDILGAMDAPAVRRWVRGELVQHLEVDAIADLAGSLLEWSEDFSPSRRDRTTSALIERLPGEQLRAHLYELAGSNSASTLWARIASDGESAVLQAARDVLSNAADPAARETTLHLLVLDPYGESPLGREAQDTLLGLALEDADPEIRGLAAEVIAADMPELLLERWDTAPEDSSERVRMAFWEAALVHRPEETFDHAGAIVLDPEREHAVRRSALIAAGERSSTRRIAPVLEALLRGDDEVLAEDAAQLMWRHHRAPDIATAASESRFERVRELAERLLHPERGSPAAGGSRPGDPTRTGEIFDQISGTGDWRGPEPEE